MTDEIVAFGKDRVVNYAADDRLAVGRMHAEGFLHV
jgi:hypothetical protein